MGFKKFERAFREEYEIGGEDPIYPFMDEYDSGRIGLGGELVKDNDVIAYDSYGSENSKLERVFFFPKYNVHIMFNGTRCSYQGEEWDSYRKVSPIVKTITKFE